MKNLTIESDLFESENILLSARDIAAIQCSLEYSLRFMETYTPDLIIEKGFNNTYLATKEALAKIKSVYTNRISRLS